MSNIPIIRLLLVDDDRVDRLACRRALAQDATNQYVILEAETGRQGLELARNERLDCIVLDHRLPDFSGVEFLAELVEENGELPIPVVMLTGTDSAQVAVEALKRGARDYLVKDAEQAFLQWLPAAVIRMLREQRIIQEKVAAEKRLREAEAKYRTLVEQIPAITYIASLETPGKLLYINPQIQQLGFPFEKWFDEPDGLLNRIHPDDRERVIEAYAKTCEQHVALRREYRLLTRDGRARWFLDEGNVVCDEADLPLFLQGVLVDITEDKETEQELEYYRRRLEDLVAQRTTQLEKQSEILKAANTNLDRELYERRRVETALRQSEARFRLLLDSVGEGILGLDTEGACTFINEAALDMLGYTREEFLGQDIAQKIYRDANKETCPAEAGAGYDFFSQRGHRSTHRLQRKDGSSFHAECSSYPVLVEGRITGAVLLLRDATEFQALTQQLSYQASHDPLTGLVNRTELERRMARVLDSTREAPSEHALCYLDLDQFKYVNDACGHAAGDELLRSLSALLQSKLRQRDTLARLGGDEFALLLEHCSLDQARSLAIELCEIVRNFHFTWEDKTFPVGVSIGVAALRNGDIASILSAADAACYMAKEKGRSRVHVFKPHDAGIAEQRAQREWVARLTRTMDEDRFRLYYQPVSRLARATGRPHYEILLRLVEKDGSLVDPGAFMPVAERYHLVPAIDRWVLRKVVAHIAEKHRQTAPDSLPVYAVNLSIASLTEDHFIEFVRQLLTVHGAPAPALCFEIVESATLTHLNQARQSIQELKALGCLFIIKNFNSVIASFDHLKTLTVDFLKLDGSFIQNLAEDPTKQAVAEAINQAAHAMGIQTVGQCADSESILEVLQELGVDYAQGDAVKIPRPWEEMDIPMAIGQKKG
ncbi:GGDEF domain-containing response regulator [Methylohalobius crimeensis]|uniref:GGDEF domain-containing response regulator n=1 Tax=Methylohalobius crimeensis TaxID=244365 RepID=UPI0003B556B1|nr:GGDEF domain-containing response regulator [Methylohalobius crimeensis]